MRAQMRLRKRPRLRNRRPDLPKPMHAPGRNLQVIQLFRWNQNSPSSIQTQSQKCKFTFPFQTRNSALPPRPLQQHQRPPRKLPRRLQTRPPGRPHLRQRRQRLQEHLPHEAANMRVRVPPPYSPDNFLTTHPGKAWCAQTRNTARRPDTAGSPAGGTPGRPAARTGRSTRTCAR